MIEDHPDVQKQNQIRGKLSTLLENIPPSQEHVQRKQMPQERIIRHHQAPSAPAHPLEKLQYFWQHKDPAYKFLIAAIATVFILSTLIAVFAGSFLFQIPALFLPSAQPGPSSEQLPPNSTLDVRPTFPVSQTGKGTKTSSLPPQSGTVATLAGTAEAMQISNLPEQVNNNSTVPVTVSTGQPGATVKLLINYNVSPYYSETSSQTADGSGNVTLYWNVRASNNGKNATAQVTATTDQGGRSQTVMVQIN